MNKQTWQALQAHGVTEDTDLRLDFFYIAPREQPARALVALIERETDYDITVASNAAGFLKKNWTVRGTTKGTKVSLEILDQWVTWMVAAGAHEDCEFDGWGTQASGF